MSVQEIEQQISALQRRKQELQREEISEFKERAKVNIGRCFRTGDKYIKVVGVPIKEETMTGPIFNKYQYPALYLSSGVVPFYEDTLFSAAWGEGNNLLGARYEEITPEEFNEAFDKRISEFRKQIVEQMKI